MSAKRKYTPVGNASALWKCDAKEVLCFSGAGTGKTRAALEKVALACRKYPGCRVLLTRATRASMTESTLVTLERDVLVTATGKPEPWVGQVLRRVRQSYRLPNGSEIVVAGMDTPDRLLSTEFDYAVIEEATEVTQEGYELVLSRLRNGVARIQQAICLCNPTSPLHWLHERMSAGTMVPVIFTHKDNPRWWSESAQDWTKEGREYIEGTLGRLTGVRRARLLEGKWAAAEGLVYDNFDRAVNVRGPVAPTVRRVVGVDDGFTHPFVALLAEVDGDGRIHIAGERYQSGLRETQKVELVRELVAGDAYTVVVVDPAAASLRASLRHAGLAVVEANNDVLPGIGRVHDRMAVAGDGYPRLTIAAECSNLLKELETYQWNDKTVREQPVKEYDDAADALRYATMQIDRSDVSRVYTSSEEPKRDVTPPPREWFRQQRESDPNFGFDPDDDV